MRLSKGFPKIGSGMQSSPWLIIGATIIMLTIVLTLAIREFNREMQHMYRVLNAKGAALIRTVEAGSRTGMMGMAWGGSQVQAFLEEASGLPDVLYLAVIDKDGMTLAHSEPGKIGERFRQADLLVHLGPAQQENSELITSAPGPPVFEVHRYFQPLAKDSQGRPGHLASRAKHHRMMGNPADWFDPLKRQQYIIVVGMDIAHFQETIRGNIRNTLFLSILLLLMGFAGLVALFWMQNYYTAKRSLDETSVLADEIVANLPVGLVATDRHGRIRFFNSAVEKISGLRQSEAIGKIATDVLPQGLCGLQDNLGHGRVISERELDCAFQVAGVVPVSASATRIVNQNGEFAGDVLILRDLGEIRRLQEEIRRQEKLAALGSLAAGVAHEIRNPLSSVKGLATYFAGKFDVQSEEYEVTQVMVAETDRLNRVISDLLDFAKPSDLKRRRTDLGAVLTHSLGLVQQDAQAKKVRIDTRIAQNLCRPYVDPDRLSQCLLNLYLNALQAMSVGGQLSVSASNRSPDRVLIEICDNGPGITADRIENVFNPYYTTKAKGTGLGLAIVHKIITAHGGRISVECPRQGGTCFSIELPCHTDRGNDEKE